MSFTGPFTPDIQAKIQSIISDDPLSWDIACRTSLRGTSMVQHNPALVELVEFDNEANEKLLPRTGKALVPGCGKGYDVVYFARTLGLDATGVEISETAREAAKKYISSQPPILTGSATVIVTDFFSHSGTYDLVYDYTFFVALPLARRAEWGSQMQKLVKRGGVLVTLMYPFIAPDKVEQGYMGPPWPVTLDAYAEVLGTEWERVWTPSRMTRRPQSDSRESRGS
ncbi:S-adenosyl-L-methionine-dependent methyltransferase [Mucidula mucida]|nr:S-adenosyl-L-methionine-dependent methyltransferase [Mucidula mucida]